MRQVICFGVQFILCYGPFALDVWCDKILILNYHSIPHSRDEFNTVQFLYFINHLSSIFYFYYWMMNTVQKRWVLKVIQRQEKTTDLTTKNLRRYINPFPDKCDASFPLLLTPSSKKSPIWTRWRKPGSCPSQASNPDCPSHMSLYRLNSLTLWQACGLSYC